MRKLFFAGLLCAVAAAGHAQTAIRAGAIQLGGNVGYSQSSSAYTAINYGGSIGNTSDTEFHSFSVAPNAGYFVADNLAVGLSVLYFSDRRVTTFSAPYNSSETARTKSFSIGPFVQYYRMLTSQFGLTGTLGAGYRYLTTNTEYTTGSSTGDTDMTSKAYYTSLTPGVVFFPVPKLALGASVGSLAYSHGRNTYTDNLTNVTYNENSGSAFSANFGLSALVLSGTYYFHR